MKNLFALLLMLAFSSGAFEVDEDNLFGDKQSLVVDSALVGENLRQSGQLNVANSPVLFWGGEVRSFLGAEWSRTALDKGGAPGTRLGAVGVIHADARLPNNHKAYMIFELQSDATADTTGLRLREMFVDVHWRHRIYVRAGKQILQWGRAWFWNPSDLINVERKELVERLGAREGSQGVRVHIPLGTEYNFYAFLDGRSAQTPQEFAGAFKMEALLGRTEGSVGLWGRLQGMPVFAADVSTRIGRWNVVGEGAILSAEKAMRLERRGDTLWARQGSDWTPRVSLGLGRGFRVLGMPDRMQVHYEYFYNGAGQKGNPWGWQENFEYGSLVRMGGLRVPRGGLLPFVLGSGLYQPYHFGRHYAAAFWSLRNVAVQGLTLSLSSMNNLEDRSYAFTTALQYSTLNNMDLEMSLLSLGGKSPAEFTMLDRRLWLRSSVGLRF